MTRKSQIFAHSLSDSPSDIWEPLSDHLRAVGEKAAEFAAPFGWSAAGQLAGLLHDIGKVSAAYQAYIATPEEQLNGRRGPDHSTAGARVVAARYPGKVGRLIAFGIAGHHAGLADFADLNRRLNPQTKTLEAYDGWEEHVGSLPDAASLRPSVPWRSGTIAGFSEAFLTRMLFSCLVDADFLATEEFYAHATGKPVERGGHASIETLRDRLRRHMQTVRDKSRTSAVNEVRNHVLDHALAKASLAPGFFTLTVPTGGGKTLASLSFALKHAAQHELRRVVYVIPFTSIIEQTAAVFRQALATDDDVLEHHASFDWDARSSVEAADDEGQNGLSKLRRAAENWDAPIVVTTAVQFFESLFAARTSRCRKLHNLAGAVIVLDEAQSLPLAVLRPCLAALDELARNYRATVILCTATQPAWRQIDGALIDHTNHNFGLSIETDRELAPEPEALFTRLKRVSVEIRPGTTDDSTIADRFTEQDRMLCIVNSRAHARTLFDLIAHLPGALHLTTLMCSRHRQSVLAEARRKLRAREPVRLVATSLIEAGVDIDFPEVWRAEAGLDSIAQAAGRCNREGALADLGRTFVFTPADAKPPHVLETFAQAARGVLRIHGDDPLSPQAIHAYFRALYWQKGAEALDALEIGGIRGILAALEDRAKHLTFPFASIAEKFRLIDDVMQPVIVPFDADAERHLNALGAMDKPSRQTLRRLQPYIVSIPTRARQYWLGLGVLSPAHPALGDALLKFEDLAHYRAESGLDLTDIGMRGAEANIL
jgi:CRISPR-associated endonuclease/helicase Cas3